MAITKVRTRQPTANQPSVGNANDFRPTTNIRLMILDLQNKFTSLNFQKTGRTMTPMTVLYLAP